MTKQKRTKWTTEMMDEYLKDVQTRCFNVGLLERSEKAKQYVKSVTNDLPVENSTPI